MNSGFCQHSCATAHSAADARHGVCQGQDSCGFQEARAAPEVFCENHLRVCVDVCVLEEGWEVYFYFTKRRHCAMVQSRLTRAKEQNHSFTSGGMCVLRRFVQGSAGSSSPAPSPAPSPAAAGSSPASSAAKLAMSSCTATHSATAAIVSCIGCSRRHAGGSGSSYSTLRSMHGVVPPVAATGGPPITTCADTWPWDLPSVHGATRDWHPLPVEHTAALQHQQRTR